MDNLIFIFRCTRLFVFAKFGTYMHFALRPSLFLRWLWFFNLLCFDGDKSLSTVWTQRKREQNLLWTAVYFTSVFNYTFTFVHIQSFCVDTECCYCLFAVCATMWVGRGIPFFLFIWFISDCVCVYCIMYMLWHQLESRVDIEMAPFRWSDGGDINKNTLLRANKLRMMSWIVLYPSGAVSSTAQQRLGRLPKRGRRRRRNSRNIVAIPVSHNVNRIQTTPSTVRTIIQTDWDRVHLNRCAL